MSGFTEGGVEAQAVLSSHAKGKAKADADAESLVKVCPSVRCSH